MESLNNNQVATSKSNNGGSGSEEELKIDKESKSQTKYETLQEGADEKTKELWEAEQNKLREKLEVENRFEWVFDKQNSANTTLKKVAAVDISYSKTNSQLGVACLLIYDFETKKIVYEDYENETTEYPYIPGFLAFKEVPAYTILFDRLKK